MPRAYRDGDELRRVHWRSTARYGELMVRREEQRWRNRAVLFLDTRRGAHGGRGPASSFEYAVSAAASIGVHLAREDMDTEFVTDTGPVNAPGSFEDVLLDTLAVIRPSRHSTIVPALANGHGGGSGLLIVVLGQISLERRSGWPRPATRPGRRWPCCSPSPPGARSGRATGCRERPARSPASWPPPGGGWRPSPPTCRSARPGRCSTIPPASPAPHRPERPMNHRLTVTAAAATVLASIALYPLIAGAGWFWAGIGAVIVVAAVGARPGGGRFR